MSPPTWLSLLLAGVMLGIAVYCGGRLVAAGAWRRDSELDADGVHLVMGVAMAGMLVPRLSFLPARVLELVFGLAAAWFAGQVFRLRRGSGAGRRCCPYPAPHLAESLAMVYMLAAVTASGNGNAGAAMAGMSGVSGMARFPAVALVLALLMVGYALWLGDRLVSLSRAVVPTGPGRGPSPAPPAGQGWPVLAPRAAACSKIAMAATMAYMLIMMV